MKKIVSLLLIFVLVLSFTACGGSGQDAAGAAGGQAQSGSEAKTEAAPAQGAEEWDPSVENIFEYENGQLLMENESVRFTATSLVNRQVEKGMMVTVNLKMENLTDSPVKIRMYRDGKANQSWVANLDPGEVYERDTVPVYDWNGKVDAGEESFLEHCMVRATMDDIDIGAAVFDLYASKTTPFVNINTDLEEIASTWGELKDPIDVTGELHENASSDDSASNETTKKDTSSEDVRILVAFVMSENNHTIWNAVKEAVAREGVDLEYMVSDSTKSMVEYFNTGYIDMCIGGSKAAFSEAGRFSVKSEETDATVKKYADFLEKACPVGYMNFTPVYLCSDQYSSVDEVPADSVVNISRDVSSTDSSYMMRSLQLLEAAGLVTLKDESELTGEFDGFGYFVKDNPKGLRLSGAFVEEALSNMAAYAAFTLPGQTVGNVLFEDPFKDDPDYWEAMWVNKDLVSDPARLDAVEKIVEAYQSEANLENVENPVGWDVDLIGQYRESAKLGTAGPAEPTSAPEPTATPEPTPEPAGTFTDSALFEGFNSFQYYNGSTGSSMDVIFGQTTFGELAFTDIDMVMQLPDDTNERLINPETLAAGATAQISTNWYTKTGGALSYMVYNPSDSPAAIDDCVLIGVQDYEGMQFANGLRYDSKPDQIIAVLGEPNEIIKKSQWTFVYVWRDESGEHELTQTVYEPETVGEIDGMTYMNYSIMGK